MNSPKNDTLFVFYLKIARREISKSENEYHHPNAECDYPQELNLVTSEVIAACRVTF